jgi:carbamate kinase
MKNMVLAIGGNTLFRPGEKGTISEQLTHAREVAAQIVDLIRHGYHIVLTHGNGPQVGVELLLSERATDQGSERPLDVCGASTQGEIGYLLQQALSNELTLAGLHVPVATVVTQCLVSLDDLSMSHPTKPIGPFYSPQEADDRRLLCGWKMVEDASRGYRRVVPSPQPIEIVELEVIRDLVDREVLVIACGGGGIPVACVDGRLRGVEAVIDKDHASALLAAKLGAELLVIATDTDYVYLDYGTPRQKPLYRVGPCKLEEYSRAGHFPAGSMGPKVEAVLQFLRCGGSEVIITSCENICSAVAGLAGTHIVPEQAGPSRDLALEREFASQ